MQRRRLLTLALVLVTGACVPYIAPLVLPEKPQPPPTAATPEPPTVWPSLLESQDPWLQHELERKLAGLGFEQAVRSGRLAVALVDITRPAQPRMAAVNPYEAIYAASLPKIAILLAAFQAAADGTLELDESALDELTAMIRVSSNSAATSMLERVGYQYVADVLTMRYALYDPALNGGLWVGKPYAKEGAWRRDPLHNLSHAASVYAVARFYYLLETGQLVSPAASAAMKAILGDPGIHHKFVAGLESARPGSRIFRKSGTWQIWHADSGVVERDERRYIAVALSQDPDGALWLSKLIVALDDVIFNPANVARDGLSRTALAHLSVPPRRHRRS